MKGKVLYNLCLPSLIDASADSEIEEITLRVIDDGEVDHLTVLGMHDLVKTISSNGSLKVNFELIGSITLRGLLVMLAVPKENRYVADYSSVVLFNDTPLQNGTVDEIALSVDSETAIRSRIFKIIAENTSLDYTEVVQWVKDGKWLDRSELEMIDVIGE